MRFIFPLLLLLCTGISCVKNAEPAPAPTSAPSPPSCQIPARFPKLTMRVRVIVDSTFIVHTSYDTAYFSYNALGQLDSLTNLYGSNQAMKVIYLPDGRVSKLIHYYNNQIRTDLYAYSGNTVTVTGGYVPITYDIDANGALTTSHRPNSKDKEVFTTDLCLQTTREQRFYIANNQEHYLYESAFSDVFDPLYLAGLHRILPGHSNLHLPAWTQIVHWDCADYDGSKVYQEQQTNTEGFATVNRFLGWNKTVYYHYQ